VRESAELGWPARRCTDRPILSACLTPRAPGKAAYTPHAKDWIKEQAFNHLKRLAA